MQNKYSLALLIGVGLVSGFVFFSLGVVLAKLDVASFSGEVTAGNILQSLATLAAAFIVTLLLQKLAQADRKEKDLVIAQLDELMKVLAKLDLEKEEQAWSQVTAYLKRLSQQVAIVRRLAEYCHYDDETVPTVTFTERVAALRRLTTDTPIQDSASLAAVDRPVIVRDGIVTWSRTRIQEIDTELDELKSAVLYAQFCVNRI